MSDTKTESLKPSSSPSADSPLSRQQVSPQLSADRRVSEAPEHNLRATELLRCPHCNGAIFENDLRIDGLLFDCNHLTLSSGKIVACRPLSLKILRLLLLHTGQAISYDRLHTIIYGDMIDGGPSPKIFPVIAHQLRHFIKEHNLPYTIETVWGEGFRLHRGNPNDISTPKHP